MHKGGQSCVGTARRGEHFLLFHLHDVVARGQIIEEIGSRIVRGGESDDEFASIQGGVVIGIAVECDHGIGNAAAVDAVVLHLISIEVIPDVVTDTATVVVAEVRRQVIDARAQRHIMEPGTIGTAADTFQSRRHVRVRLIHIHQVVPRIEVREEVVAAGIGAPGDQEQVTGINGSVVVHVVIELHGDVCKQRLPAVHHAVFIRVDPQGVADAGGQRSAKDG